MKQTSVEIVKNAGNTRSDSSVKLFYKLLTFPEGTLSDTAHNVLGTIFRYTALE